MHNSDASIEAVGPQSAFEYMTAYNFYKQFFIENLIEGGEAEQAMLDLFAWHNGHIFPNSVGQADEEGNDAKRAANDNAKAAARKAFSKARVQSGGPSAVAPAAPQIGDPFTAEASPYSSVKAGQT